MKKNDGNRRCPVPGGWCRRFVLLGLVLILARLCLAQVYFFEAEEVVFEFDSRQYAKAAAEGREGELDFSDLKIHEVIVSGKFKDWKAEDWRMKKVGKYKFQLRKPVKSFNDPFSWEFKFLVNGQYWVAPLPGANRQKVQSNDFWLETYNLALNKVEPDEHGNALFRLQGFESARQVILAGSFNNWNEKYLKMNRVAGGWELRLELPPGRYEYKFIADGQWLHDPENPDKVVNEHQTYNSVLLIKKQVSFQLSGFQNARQVILAGSFNNWNEGDIRMERRDDRWAVTLYLPGGKHLYKFIVDGKWITDPANPLKETDRHGHVNSVLMVR